MSLDRKWTDKTLLLALHISGIEYLQFKPSFQITWYKLHRQHLTVNILWYPLILVGFKRILWHKQIFSYLKTFPHVCPKVSFIGHVKITHFVLSESLNSLGFHCSKSWDRFPSCTLQQILRNIFAKYLMIIIFSLTYNNGIGDVCEESLFSFINCCFSTNPHSLRQALEILRKDEKNMKSTLIRINHTKIPLFRNRELWDFSLFLQNFEF